MKKRHSRSGGPNRPAGAVQGQYKPGSRVAHAVGLCDPLDEYSDFEPPREAVQAAQQAEQPVETAKNSENEEVESGAEVVRPAYSRIGPAEALWRKKNNILPWLPIAAALVFGYIGAPAVWYANDFAALLALIAIFNPFCILSRFLAPTSRACIVIDIALCIVVFEVPGLDIRAKVFLGLIGGIVAALCFSKTGEWMVFYKALQSDDVDHTMSIFRYGGVDKAEDVWSKTGCRETRAFIHQTFGVEMTERQLRNGLPHGMFLFAFNKGVKFCEARLAKMEKSVAQMQADQAGVKKLKERLQDAEIAKADADASLKNADLLVADLRKKLDFWKSSAMNYDSEIESIREASVDERIATKDAIARADEMEKRAIDAERKVARLQKQLDQAIAELDAANGIEDDVQEQPVQSIESRTEYTDEELSAIVEQTSQRKAEQQTGIPRSTLMRRVEAYRAAHPDWKEALA